MARKKSYGKKPKETMRQRQQRLLREQRARKAAKTKPVKASSSTPSSSRVEKVKVRVEGQKSLPAGKTQKALPPGKKGGAVSTSNRPRRRNVNTNPPSNTTRTGRQSAAAANREVQATRRAGTQARRPGRGGLIAPLAIGGAIGNWMTNNLPRTATPSGRGSGRATDRVQPGPPKKEEKSKPKARGMTNIPPSEGSRNNPNYGKPGNPNSANKPKPKAENQKPPTSDKKPTPTPKPASTKSTPVRSGATSRKASVPQSKNMDANYKAWAKANPKLAAKVKKGQAGYNAINNKPTATKSTTSNRGGGNGAPGAAGAASRMSPKKTEPAKPKKTKSALEIAAEKRKKKKAATAKNANDRFRS